MSSFAVDPDSLRSAMSSLDDAALALTHARARLHEVLADVGAWAPDQDLRGEADALVQALSQSAAHGEAEAAELASRLARAARDYADVETAAVLATRDGDAPGRSVR